MQARLRIENSGANLRSVRLPAELVVGRSTDCRLKIASAEVSRKHCRILNTPTQVFIEDLGSSNGTVVNGRSIVPGVPTPLSNGAQILVGPVRFTLEIAVAAPADPQNVLHDDDSNSGKGKGFSFEDFQEESVASSVSLQAGAGQGAVAEESTGYITVEDPGQGSTLESGAGWTSPPVDELAGEAAEDDPGDDLGQFLRSL